LRLRRALARRRVFSAARVVRARVARERVAELGSRRAVRRLALAVVDAAFRGRRLRCRRARAAAVGGERDGVVSVGWAALLV